MHVLTEDIIKKNSTGLYFLIRWVSYNFKFQGRKWSKLGWNINIGLKKSKWSKNQGVDEVRSENKIDDFFPRKPLSLRWVSEFVCSCMGILNIYGSLSYVDHFCDTHKNITLSVTLIVYKVIAQNLESVSPVEFSSFHLETKFRNFCSKYLWLHRSPWASFINYSLTFQDMLIFTAIHLVKYIA